MNMNRTRTTISETVIKISEISSSEVVNKVNFNSVNTISSLNAGRIMLVYSPMKSSLYEKIVTELVHETDHHK